MPSSDSWTSIPSGSDFTFVQVAAPTRGALEEYRSFRERIERVCERINQRFGEPGSRPVHLLPQHHDTKRSTSCTVRQTCVL
jgi:trehalose-6-phosphate synthase